MGKIVILAMVMLLSVGMLGCANATKTTHYGILTETRVPALNSVDCKFRANGQFANGSWSKIYNYLKGNGEVESGYQGPEEVIDALAAKGWELIQVTKYISTSEPVSVETTYYFKRSY